MCRDGPVSTDAVLVTYHHTVHRKMLQQGEELWTQAVSGFFDSKGLKASFAVMNEPLLELHGFQACVLIWDCSHIRARGLLLLELS